MSVLRHAQERARRLKVLEESMGPEISGDETPQVVADYAEPVITGHPVDVVDRYTYVTQMAMDESPSGDNMGLLDKRRAVRADRFEAVVESLGELVEQMDDMEDDEDEEDYGDEEEDEEEYED